MRVSALLGTLALAVLVLAEDDYSFEKSLWKAGQVCPEMVGTWYTDVTVLHESDGKKRDITEIRREADGEAYLRGLSVFYDDQGVSYWDFSSKWSCDGQWYVEANDWGYTAFRVLSLGESENVLRDELNNLGAPQPITVTETRNLDSAEDLMTIPEVRAYFAR